MKTIIRILNTIAILLSLFYILFTDKFYEIVIKITGNTTNAIYEYVKIPYYLLWFALIFSILIKIILILINKKKNIVVIFPSDIVVFIILLASLIFTPRFEYLYYSMEPQSMNKKYDNLFVYTEFYEDENNYKKEHSDTKYIYIPIMKKMVYIDSKGIKTYEVKYIDKDVVVINDGGSQIKKEWPTKYK